MKLSDVGIALIKEFEGCILHVYKDAVGLPTIGIGHLIKPGEHYTTITQEEADALLGKDAQTKEESVTALVKVPINQNQFDALVSLVFNIGSGAFRQSTLLRKLNVKDYAGAAAEFSRWDKAGGKALAGLTRRRTAEQKLFSTPEDE